MSRLVDGFYLPSADVLGEAGAHYIEGNRTVLFQNRYLTVLFSRLFHNRTLHLDPRGVVRRSSFRRIECLKNDLRPEGHYINI